MKQMNSMHEIGVFRFAEGVQLQGSVYTTMLLMNTERARDAAFNIYTK